MADFDGIKIMSLIWTAWKNGKFDSRNTAYGLKVPVSDRDRYFDRTWKYMVLEIPASDGYDIVKIGIEKRSFWNDTCHELIASEIGIWLLSTGKAPWKVGKPPKIRIDVLGDGRFRIA